MRRYAFFVVAFGIAFAPFAISPRAYAQVYKCTDANGGTSYSDAPCVAGGKPLGIPNDPKPGSGGPTVCAQLLDESRRLAAEAERDAKRGKPRNAANEKHRQALTAQYRRRCAGISRSAP